MGNKKPRTTVVGGLLQKGYIAMGRSAVCRYETFSCAPCQAAGCNHFCPALHNEQGGNRHRQASRRTHTRGLGQKGRGREEGRWEGREGCRRRLQKEVLRIVIAALAARSSSSLLLLPPPRAVGV